MPRYRVHRIRETPRENFKWAAHTGGEVIVKLKDYEAGRIVDASTPYAAWKLLVDEREALVPGDLLEILEDVDENVLPNPPEKPPQLLIAKYIGFEPARWFVPEPKKVETAADRPSLSSEAPAPIPVHSPK